MAILETDFDLGDGWAARTEQNGDLSIFHGRGGVRLDADKLFAVSRYWNRRRDEIAAANPDAVPAEPLTGSNPAPVPGEGGDSGRLDVPDPNADVDRTAGDIAETAVKLNAALDAEGGAADAQRQDEADAKGQG